MAPELMQVKDPSASEASRCCAHFVSRTGLFFCIDDSPAAPVMPTGTGWDAAIALRDDVRREILKHCAEPDLGS